MLYLQGQLLFVRFSSFVVLVSNADYTSFTLKMLLAVSVYFCHKLMSSTWKCLLKIFLLSS